VFGGVERLIDDEGKASAGKFFAVAVEDRTRDTLEPIIQKHVASGSTIHSDKWPSYNHLDEMRGLNYVHNVVNHSEGFKAEDGTHTNTIESVWYAKLKRHIPPQAYNMQAIPGWLSKMMWIDQNKERLWDAFWELLADCTWTHEHGLRLSCEWDEPWMAWVDDDGATWPVPPWVNLFKDKRWIRNKPIPPLNQEATLETKEEDEEG
jgi:transposase-like protein